MLPEIFASRFSRVPSRLFYGYTLVELVIVITLLGILSVVAVERMRSPALMTLPSQAQKMASDIRHVQTLASTWGRSLRLAVAAGANGTYSVSCVAVGSAPCNVSPVLDPATGAAFSVTLENGMSITGTASVDFNSLGQPSGAAAYTLGFESNTVAVAVSALTGLVTVTP